MKHKIGAKVTTTRNHGGARKGDKGTVQGVHSGPFYAVAFGGSTTYVPAAYCEAVPGGEMENKLGDRPGDKAATPGGGSPAGGTTTSNPLASAFERPLTPKEWQRAMDWLLENCPA